MRATASLAFAAFAALLLSLSVQVSAQEAPDAPQSPDVIDLRTGPPSTSIVVEGERAVQEKEIENAVGEIAMRGRSLWEPMTRFQKPLCVNVTGLGTEFNDQVAERIRTNTRDANFTVDKPGCKTNALVIVVKNPNRLIERLREENPTLFNAKVNQKIKRAQRLGDAAIFWSAEQISQPNGRPIVAAESPAGAVGEAIFGNADQGAPVTSRLGTSRFKINYSIEKVFSVIVFDVEKLGGVHLDQLADYATMRMLADPQPTVEMDEESRAQTILTLFDMDPYEAPQQMTQLDRAFLRGLYTMRPNQPSTRLEKFVLSAYEEIRNEDCDERPWSRTCAETP